MAQKIPPLISAHLIMKNEANYLPRCLASLRGVVDEICIVDTGSTDGSVEIARSFGAKVQERPWTDSFSEARNAGLEAITGRWILQIDADEELHPEDGERLRQLLLTSDREGYLVDVLSYEGEQRPETIARHTVLRVWRNRKQYRFHGRIHEGLQMGKLEPGMLESSGIRLFHYGYLSAVHKAKAKSERNVQLLLKELQDEPDSPYWHFYLGTEYMNRREYERALEHFDIAARRTPPETAFAPLLVKRRILTVQLLGHHQRALELIDQAERLYPGHVDFRFLRGESLFRSGRVREALQAFQTCVQLGRLSGSSSEHMGVESYKALWWVGHLQERLGSETAAIAAYKEALRIAPHFRPACVRLVEQLRQRYPIERAMHESLVADTDEHRLRLAEAFSARGDYPAVLELLSGPEAQRSGARQCLLGSAYVRTGNVQEGLRILEQAEREGCREQAEFERVVAGWLVRDREEASEGLEKWSQEAIVDLLRALYASGRQEDLDAVEHFALDRFGATVAGKIAGLYDPSRWSKVWPAPTSALLGRLAELTINGAAMPPEDWVALARLMLRHGRFHDAMHGYHQALVLDTCWVPVYREAAEALNRRAIEVMM